MSEKQEKQENNSCKGFLQIDSDISSETENNVLTIMTTQSSLFKTLMVALKDILVETNMTFTKEGIKIINMDKSHTVVVFLNLPAENFEFYECKKDKIIVGLNIIYFFKLINSLDINDTLTMYIENKNYDDGLVSELSLKFDNYANKQCTIHKFSLLDPDHEEIFYPNITYSSIITLPSTDFQKIVRILSNISNKVEIKSVGNELIFACSGSISDTEIKRTESDTMSFVQKTNPGKIIQGVFSLKNLGYFIKCTNLCNQIEIYLENDMPLVIQYSVASLGTIRLCLSPLC